MLDARRAHFDSLFARDDDPWKYRSTWSEQRRFALIARDAEPGSLHDGVRAGVRRRIVHRPIGHSMRPAPGLRHLVRSNATGTAC